jgi:GNAT superfamily N-acetyltransferase
MDAPSRVKRGVGRTAECAMEVDGRAPGECSPQDVASFCKLVKAGGEVAEAGLEQLVNQARRLVFARSDNALVGVAALKTPRPNYKARVFRKAGVGNADDYPLELGWVFVVPEHRRQGISGRLVEAALEGTDGGAFATSRLDNTHMHGCLERHGFERSGQPYKSDDADREILLYVRRGRPTRS